jgi:hypothetical protein
MADSGPTCYLAERKAINTAFFRQLLGGVEQGTAQVAVMVAVLLTGNFLGRRRN